MTKNWKDIHPEFTKELREEWEDYGFSSSQVKEWMDIGLKPQDAEFCVWLEQAGYTALAVLNNEDAQQLRQDYQNSLSKRPLLDWYSEDKLTFSQFSQLANHLGTKVGNNYSLKELNELLITIPQIQPTYHLTKILLATAILVLITYYLLKE